MLSPPTQHHLCKITPVDSRATAARAGDRVLAGPSVSWRRCNETYREVRSVGGGCAVCRSALRMRGAPVPQLSVGGMCRSGRSGHC